MTHNSTIGYLGGFTSALFAAFAIEGIKINEWPFKLLDILKSKTIENYIRQAVKEFKRNETDVEFYLRDSHIFIAKWDRYVEDKFDENRNPVKRRSTINLVSRGRYYAEAFGTQKGHIVESQMNQYIKATDTFIGSGGDDSVIIAYDSLLDAGDNWEKLVYYGMLHIGDTDTTGCIAGGLFGILYGFKNVPNNFLEHLEYKKEIIDLGKKLYKKFK